VPNVLTAASRWASGGRPSLRLTAKERIILHLLDHVGHADALEVPAGMTQDGLAAAAWVDLRHLAQYVRPLIRDGQVRERTAHVRGARQRRKVYDLTDSGRLAGIRLRERLRGELVPVRDPGGLRSVPLGELVAGARGTLSLLDLLRAARSGPVDLERLAASPPAAHVEMVAEAPRLDAFVGRDRELALVTSAEARPRVFVVRGVPGIGKSTFAAKACDLLRGRTSVYWHRVRPWDTELSLLAGLGEFLARLGRPGLRSVLARGETPRAVEVLREELGTIQALLVYDDLHEATAELVPVFRGLKDMISDAPDVRMIALSRRGVPFYDRRDVTLHGLVKEIDLGGLGKAEVSAFFAQGPAGSEHAARSLGGHPLFLQLVRAAPHVAADARRDVRRFIEETIYGELSDSERRLMKLGSLYIVPVPRDALLPDTTMIHDVLLSLVDRALLMPVGHDRFVVHDTIREFFSDILTPSERRDFAPFAVGQLRSLAAAAYEARDAVAALDILSNALVLATSRAERVAIREAMGDAYERLGELPDILVAYKEALKEADDPLTIARIHRKTASALEFKGEVGGAGREAEAALEALRGALHAERGWIDLVRSRICAQREEWEEAKEHAEAALHAFREVEEPRGVCEAFLALGIVEINAPRGNPQEAKDHLDAALGVAEAVPDPDLGSRVHIQLAHLFAYRLGDEGQALSHVDSVLAAPESLSDPRIRRPLLMLKGWLDLEMRGDFDAAEGHFREAFLLGRRTYDGLIVSFARYGLAITTYFRGRVEEARGELGRCASELAAQGYVGTAVEALWLVAECSLLLGDLPAFRRVVVAFADPTYARGVESRIVLLQVLRGLDALLLGDPAGVRASFESALRSAAETSSPQEWPLLHFAHFFYGVALKVLGRAEEGEAHLATTREFLAAYGLRARLSLVPGHAAQLEEVLRRLRAAG
jgi:tetratricopeptide (TPR) repeat protein